MKYNIIKSKILKIMFLSEPCVMYIVAHCKIYKCRKPTPGM
jgi:hypothetical protein